MQKWYLQFSLLNKQLVCEIVCCDTAKAFENDSNLEKVNYRESNRHFLRWNNSTWPRAKKLEWAV